LLLPIVAKVHWRIERSLSAADAKCQED